jgi:transglutaminase-like putative cysteine protease
VTPISLIVALLAGAGQQPGYRVEVGEAKPIEAVLTCQLREPGVAVQEWIVVAAKAPELPGQTAVTSRVEPRATTTDDQRQHRPLLQAIVPGRSAQSHELTVRVTYRATLRSRRLVADAGDSAAPKVALRREDRVAALEPTNTYDFKSKAFQQWLNAHDMHRGKDEGDIAFARRVFRQIQSGFRYRYPTGHDGKASSTCTAGRGDCGSLCAVFVSALRVNRLPARSLVGRWAQSARADERVGGEPYSQTHVKAEFFAEGVGWVPVDPTLALEDRSTERLRFFGRDDGNFLAQHVDFDFLVNAGRFGRRPVTGLQGVAYWVSGPGTLESAPVREDWQVRTLTGAARTPAGYSSR